MNSHGWDGELPEGAIAGLYDDFTGEWANVWYFTPAEVAEAEAAYEGDDQYGVMVIDAKNTGDA